MGEGLRGDHGPAGKAAMILMVGLYQVNLNSESRPRAPNFDDGYEVQGTNGCNELCCCTDLLGCSQLLPN